MKNKPLAANSGSKTESIQDMRKVTPFRRASSDNKPTPLDFDTFIPWVCLEWQSPVVVVVTRLVQEEYKKHEHRPSTSSRTKSVEPSETGFTKSSKAESVVVPVKAYYDQQNHLVEISIIGCPFEIHRKVIQAFSLCLPFHSLLKKLTIRKGGVSFGILREIGKLLPHSNLTDVCLDDCIVPEGNYDVIFEQTSQLKSLSLNRCSIDDTMCKRLAEKIDIECTGSSLLTLDLGSNLITDEGTKAIAEILRRNRRLLHLNLSGNQITDDGASSIFTHMVEFPLTWHEIWGARWRKTKYTEKKAVCYERCLKQVQQKSARRSMKNKNLKKKKSQSDPEEKSAAEVVEEMTLGIIGKYSDPFDDNNIVIKGDITYAKGNLVLCSLNIAYNKLTYLSIKKIDQLLKYQDQLVKPLDSTGLIRIVFEGNYIPTSCVEYDRIEMYLKTVVSERALMVTPCVHRRRSAASSKRS